MALYINYLTKEIMFTLSCSRFPCRACFTASQVIPSKDSYFILRAMLEFKLETCLTGVGDIYFRYSNTGALARAKRAQRSNMGKKIW